MRLVNTRLEEVDAREVDIQIRRYNSRRRTPGQAASFSTLDETWRAGNIGEGESMVRRR
jgi:hypothetical protein